MIGHDEKTKQSIVCTNEAIATYKRVIKVEHDGKEIVKDVHVCEQHNRYFQDQIKEQKEYEVHVCQQHRRHFDEENL